MLPAERYVRLRAEKHLGIDRNTPPGRQLETRGTRSQLRVGKVYSDCGSAVLNTPLAGEIANT